MDKNNIDINSNANLDENFDGTELSNDATGGMSRPNSDFLNSAADFKRGINAGLGSTPFSPNKSLAQGLMPKAPRKSDLLDKKPNNTKNDSDNSDPSKDKLGKKGDNLADNSNNAGMPRANRPNDPRNDKANNSPASNGGQKKSSASPNPLTSIKNRVANLSPVLRAKNTLAKIGIGSGSGLDENDDSDSDNDNAGSTETLTNKKKSPTASLSKFSLLTVEGGIDLKKMSILVIGLTVLILAIIIMILVAIIDAEQNSMCANNATSTYTGSQDALEFMCKMGNPFGEDYDHQVTCKVGDTTFHTDHVHQGIDIGCSTGTPIYAVQDAKVVRASYDGGRGNYVFLDHGDGFGTVYQHLSEKSPLKEGDTVLKGQQVGKCGNTGNSFGSHLHFEINNKPASPYNNYLTAPNDFFGPEGTNIKTGIESFRKNCGSSAASVVNTSTISSGPSEDSGDVKTYDSLKSLKTITSSTGKTKKIYLSQLRLNPQSMAYNNGNYYILWTHLGGTGKNGRVAKYDKDFSLIKRSSSDVSFGHGNGLAYSTVDNKLYATTTSRVPVGKYDNKYSTVIDPETLKEVTPKKDLEHGSSGIAFDRLTKKFVTSSGAASGKSSDKGYLYVYDSNLSNQSARITKKRWDVAQDIAAYGGIVYVCVHSDGGNDYIDMYNEDNGDYLGSYTVKDYELESLVINDAGEIVILYHGTDMVQFTGIKAKVIKGTSDASTVSSADCCVTTSNVSTASSSSGGNYCPSGIIVTGNNAGTYDLDEYVEKVVTAENGGAHPEALKALAIAARTYAINRTNNCEKTIPNSTAAQVMAAEASDKVKTALQSVKGAVMLYNGNIFSAQYSSFWGSCNGNTCTSTFKKTPSDETATYSIPKSYVTIARGHEYGLSQNGSNYMATEQGKTYDEILKFFYADGVEITGASSSNSCSLGGSGTFKNGKIWDYNQADYSDAYCGGTIANSGCGPTAMAMVVSTMLNAKHDPPELAKASSTCSTKSHNYFVEAAKKYGLTARTTKEHDEVLTALNRGDSLVIANVSPATVNGINNFWTSYGHYIVLAGHSGRDVWVQDPHKGGDGRGNDKGDGVYNFDTYIKPAVDPGYIIITKGVSA